MIFLPERFACEVDALVGSPFRLYGRDPATGIDCIGLVLCALANAGIGMALPCQYRLRNTDISPFLAFADRLGLERVNAHPTGGDIRLVEIAPTQFHLLALNQDRQFVHAHAGLRRVVRQTAVPHWPVRAHWRIPHSLEDTWPLLS